MQGRTVLGRYKISRLLGEGGMGKVFVAQQLDNSREVVVKVLHEQLVGQTKFREAFKREIDFMSRFRHPYAVELYEASLTDPAGPCMVMEYIRGMPLVELLEKKGKFRPQRVGRILGQLCAVLQVAHDHGIVHRDLKPANILIMHPETPHEKVKLMDFGVAKRDASPSGTPMIAFEKLTAASANFAVGTPQYLCPEQARGAESDHRGDLYSVGVILYELLTGRRPFDAPTISEILDMHVYKEPPPFDDPLIPAPLEELVRGCLAKYPEERPQSARELAECYEIVTGQKIVNEDDFKLPEGTPPPVVEEPVARPQDDPNAVVYRMEAWMPESIAVVKIRGFLQERGGEVLESVAGVIRMRLERPVAAPVVPLPRPQKKGWFGFGGKQEPEAAPQTAPVEAELYMKKKDPQKPNELSMTLVIKDPRGRRLATDPEAKAWCDQLYIDVSSYLMAKRG